MVISDETLQAVYSYIASVDFAMKHFPDMPVSRIFDCGCMGPKPECRCSKRNRLKNEFMAIMKEAKE